MPNLQPNAALYTRQMAEVKLQFRAIDKILEAKSPLMGSDEIDIECGFLQVRKIVELIVFSAILSDELRYQQMRQIEGTINPKINGDYTKDWNAADILGCLSKISPHFLPIPLGPMVVKPDGVKHFGEAKAKITRDRLTSIYKITGGYLHAQSPFKKNSDKQRSKKKQEARILLARSLDHLKAVIWEHIKIGLAWSPGSDPTQLDDGETAWLIHLGDQSTDEVKVAIAIAQ